jgi:hypothetical protein
MTATEKLDLVRLADSYPRLGKKPVRVDPRTLKFATYLRPEALPTPPEEVSWVVKVPSWPMMLNDRLGSCTCAAAGHMIEQWSYYAGDEYIPTDDQILAAYEILGGYIPGQPDTDGGANILEVLNYWRQVGIADHKIVAYVSVNRTDRQEIIEAIRMFGSLYLGVELPWSARGMDKWYVADGGTATELGFPGGWGGHAVPLFAASPKTLTCVTWGRRLKMSWNFFEDYASELYAILSQDWIEKQGKSPSGFDLAALQADLAQLV